MFGANGEKDRTDDFYYDKPSIIVGRKGSAGEINLTEGKFWALDVTYFVTFDDRSYDLRFLYYLLTTLNLPALAKGVKPGINRNEVYAIQVLVPSVQEQKRIVAIIDQAFEAIEIATRNAANDRPASFGPDLMSVRQRSESLRFCHSSSSVPRSSRVLAAGSPERCAA